MDLAIIILAAGKGTRMESDLAKVLHPLCGKPLVAWVLAAAAPLQAKRTVVVVGHQAEAVEAAVREYHAGAEFARQTEMLGTGHAVQQTEAALGGFEGDIIVTCGDAPLIETATLQRMVRLRRERGSAAVMLVAVLDDPGSYGRVLCEADGRVTQIVERKDASPEQLAVQTVNAGTYCFDSRHLWEHLGRIDNQNRSGEFYLTDVVGLMNEAGLRVDALTIGEREMTGVNTKGELAALEAELSS